VAAIANTAALDYRLVAGLYKDGFLVLVPLALLLPAAMVVFFFMKIRELGSTDPFNPF